MKAALAAFGLLLAVAAQAGSAPTGVNASAVVDPGFPPSLAAFGFFTDASRQQPANGVVPYRLNTPLWSDGAEKLRFIYVPDGQRALANGDGLLQLPLGSAIIKTFKLGGRLIETRVLLHRAEGWVALPYLWNPEQTTARLALAGARLDLTTPAGQAISYAVPNKNQCKECHGLNGAVTPIGPKAYNLDIAWLAAWQRAGKLDRVPVVNRRIPMWENRAEALAGPMARGYLDANCAHCHNPAGSASNSGLDLRWEQLEPIKIGIWKRPVAAGRGSGSLEFDIKPGDPAASILYHRMGSLEGGVSMPELGRSSLDPDGMAVVARWIREMEQ